MTFLTTLKFTYYDDTRPSLVERRRMKLVDNLKDQLALLNDPSYAKTRYKWIKAGDEKTFKERKVPVRPWWRELPEGHLAFFIRSGLRKIEFKKGQSAILLDSREKLPELINGLIAAVVAGELDIHLNEKPGAIQTTRKRAA